MDRAFKIMLWFGWCLSITLVILWPLLALPAGVFSKGALGLCIWLFYAVKLLAQDWLPPSPFAPPGTQ